MFETYGQDGGILGEHPHSPDHLAGIEAATGSLGHGLPIGLGMALSARIQNHDYKVYALLGDGECNEGSVWEAALMAAAQKVDNLMVFVDFNKWQGTGRSEEILALSPFVEKWRAFGWDACEVDGNDMGQLLEALSRKNMFTSRRLRFMVLRKTRSRNIPISHPVRLMLSPGHHVIYT